VEDGGASDIQDPCRRLSEKEAARPVADPVTFKSGPPLLSPVCPPLRRRSRGCAHCRGQANNGGVAGMRFIYIQLSFALIVPRICRTESFPPPVEYGQPLLIAKSTLMHI
jgi:hypothetical protein